MTSVKKASFVILEKDNSILLLRRFNTGYEDGKYTLPSGHVDPGESFTQAAVRESMEEVGIVIDPTALRSAHILHRKKPSGDIYVDHFFFALSWKNDIENKEPHKCDDLRWCPIEQLPENMLPFVKHALNEIYEKKNHYSEFGF